jgi:hypothetical protein
VQPLGARDSYLPLERRRDHNVAGRIPKSLWIQTVGAWKAADSAVTLDMVGELDDRQILGVEDRAARILRHDDQGRLPSQIIPLGGGLGQAMSQYLIDRIAAAPNFILHSRTELVAHSGTAERGLEQVRWRDHGRGVEEDADIRNVFCFIDADPATTWLADCGVDLHAGDSS